MNQINKNEVPTQEVLRIDGISKSYGKHKALDEINLRINTGEFVALLGPNGAGKTTLFQLLTGLFVPDDGSIFIDDYDIRHNIVEALAGIGVVFQQPALDLDLSAAANLRLHASLHGINKRDLQDRIDDEIGRLKIQDRLDEPVRNLSGGNRRKVELARALLHRPKILFMDEASIGLDPAARLSLEQYVKELCLSRDVAILWATHLVDEAEDADRVIVLHQGRIKADSIPAGLLEQTNTKTVSEAFLKLTENDKNKKDSE